MQCGVGVASCNPFVIQSRGTKNVKATVCSEEAWPPAVCSADQPGATTGTGSAASPQVKAAQKELQTATTALEEAQQVRPDRVLTAR